MPNPPPPSRPFWRDFPSGGVMVGIGFMILDAAATNPPLKRWFILGPALALFWLGLAIFVLGIAWSLCASLLDARRRDD